MKNTENENTIIWSYENDGEGNDIANVLLQFAHEVKKEIWEDRKLEALDIIAHSLIKLIIIKLQLLFFFQGLINNRQIYSHL